MSKYVFLYRESDSDDRDCCKYIEKTYHLDRVGEVNFHGACYCGRFGGAARYEEIDTVLSREDYELIVGGNISKEDYDRIVGILESDEGQAFFAGIIESEKEYIYDEYGLDSDDVDFVFNEYSLDYRDRGVIGRVYEDEYDVGYDYVTECCRIDDWLSNYIDYEKVGDDMVDNDECYIRLDDGRVVSVNY